jgi:hypothetical protein
VDLQSIRGNLYEEPPMNTACGFCTLIALLLQIATAPATAAKIQAKASAPLPARSVAMSQAAGVAGGGALAALEQKLLGTWRGGPCVGNYTFNADGTYKLSNFTPGSNTLTGTWSLRWDALPPTLVVTCKTSDFKARDPGRREYEYFDKPLEIKLVELSDDLLVLRFPADKKVGFPSDYSETYTRRAEQ